MKSEMLPPPQEHEPTLDSALSPLQILVLLQTGGVARPAIAQLSRGLIRRSGRIFVQLNLSSHS